MSPTKPAHCFLSFQVLADITYRIFDRIMFGPIILLTAL